MKVDLSRIERDIQLIRVHLSSIDAKLAWIKRCMED